MNYYRLLEDMYVPQKWYLGDINVDDNWIFTNGSSIYKEDVDLKLKVEIYQKGNPLDFTCTDPYCVPIISKDFAECLFSYSQGIEILPVSVEGLENEYFILVVKSMLDCIDEGKTKGQKYTLEDGIRPDKVGEYMSIHHLRIDASKATSPIFRLQNFGLDIIINADVKKELEKNKITGVKFELAS